MVDRHRSAAVPKLHTMKSKCLSVSTPHPLVPGRSSIEDRNDRPPGIVDFSQGVLWVVGPSVRDAEAYSWGSGILEGVYYCSSWGNHPNASAEAVLSLHPAMLHMQVSIEDEGFLLVASS